MKAMLESGKIDAAADQAFDQIGVGHGAGEVGALGQIRRRGFVGGEAQLEGHGVFAQDVGQAFEFAVRRREERDAIAVLDHVLGFGDGDLHAAVEGHSGARGDVRRVWVQIEFAESDLAARSEAGF